MPRAKYGSVKKVEDAKAALPAEGAGQAAPAAVDPARALQAAQSFAPPNIGLGAPSARPDEPITTGLGDPSMGMPRRLPPIDYLKALYAKTRNPDLMDLIVLFESRGAR